METSNIQNPNSGKSVNRRYVALVTAGLIPLGLILAAIALDLGPARKEAKASEAKQGASLPMDIVIVTGDQLRELALEPVSERAIDVERETTGRVAFNEDRMTPVFTPYAGRVVELLANKGALVESGQPLLILESPDLVAAQNDLASARSDENKAKIALDTAQKTADRAHNLFAQEAVAAKDVQQADAELARAKDEKRRAMAAVAGFENRLALFGKNAQEIAQLDGRVDRRVTLRAPIGGTIVDRKVGAGQYIKPDMPEPLFLISDLSTLWVMVDVYESYLSGIRLGQPVEISVSSYPGRTFPARISFINPTVDPVTRTVHVRCSVSNPGNLLKPDMFAMIKIGGAASQKVPCVPTSALIARGSEMLIFVEESPGRFRRRAVKAGHDLRGYTVLEQGALPGERVVTHGVLLLNTMVQSDDGVAKP
jgi:cobalt-zinc-cadmium efflux system membrane fusion protein